MQEMKPSSQKRDRKRKRRGNRHSTEAAPPLSPSVILFYNHRDSRVYSFSVYALNVAAVLEDNGDDTNSLPPPLFRFERKKFPTIPGYAALGSKIYIFGGFNSAEACKDNPALGAYSLDTYVFDTTEHLPPPSDDPKAFLLKGPSLNAPKTNPISVVFKGKIYVFPRRFSRQAVLLTSRTPVLGPKCEVLDPDHGSWTALPDPPLLDQHDRVKSRKDYTVVAYAVYDGMFVASTARGIYCLNLDNPIKWNHLPLLAGFNRFPFIGKAISLDEKHYLAIHPSQHLLVKHDFTSEEGLVKEEDSLDLQPGNQRYYNVDYNMVYLGDDKLLVIRSGLDKPLRKCPFVEESTNFITYNIIQLKNKKKKKNQSGLVQLASSTFIMADNPGTCGHPVACFPM
ncbi:hypothetical protein COLO4_29430 [Corchorus olitorius]|uniref:Kelch repeat type 1 n=1 Tax=Corchorus olitorius TaxID=93759 RepID=A0A1R3HEG1_9ROSI|nr:hypothetical protein COLO4_29430 [Corchorus olitorius]